ncbi:unnamed protein product [Dracunculus medinensis]|uniref:Neur_chan_memb domain-containing protein n=1 Tax=Dracunculus medinensis TaxID=318479 RepID=A0A0N4UMN1_DRAME|nr:unnamed protein product [Dracunculus medinensis]
MSETPLCDILILSCLLLSFYANSWLLSDDNSADYKFTFSNTTNASNEPMGKPFAYIYFHSLGVKVVKKQYSIYDRNWSSSLQKSQENKSSTTPVLREAKIMDSMLHRDAARLVRGGSINSLKCLYGSGNMNKYQTIKQKSNECFVENNIQNANINLIKTSGESFEIEMASDILETTLREISDFLRILRERMDEEDEEEEGHDDWRFVAMVIDRFCLFLFSGAIIIASIFILVNKPEIYVAASKIFSSNT